MNLSTTEMQDYLFCPQYHQHKWPSQVLLPKVRARNYWHDTLIHTFITYCSSWSQSEKTDIQYLQDLWKKNWMGERPALDWIGTKQNEHSESYLAEGWVILSQAHKYFSDKYQKPAAVGMRYNMPIGNHILNGHVDLLFYSDSTQRNLEAYKLARSTFHATKIYGHNNPEITAWAQYLQKITNTISVEDPIIKYYILDNVDKPVVNTSRNINQQAVLEHTVNSIAYNIENKLYWPDFSWKCEKCNYKRICNKAKYIEGDTND